MIGLGEYLNRKPETKPISPPPKEDLNDIQTIETNIFIDAYRADEYYQKAEQLKKQDAGYGLENVLHRAEK